MASGPRTLVLSIFSLLLAFLVLFSRPSSAQVVLPLPATEQVKIQSQPSSPGLGDADLVIRPDNPQVMYWALLGVGVLKSVDGGSSWTVKNYGLPTVSVTHLAMDPLNPNHLIVSFDGHVGSQGPPPYRSLDGAE